MQRLQILMVLSALGWGCGDPSDPADASIDGGVDGGSIDAASTDGGSDAGPLRSTALGFTPFPYDVTTAAVDQTYERLANDGDLYAFHTTEGVPWVEAAADANLEEYGPSLRDKWTRHRAEIDAHPNHRVYLGLTPLDDSRTRLADYWSASEHEPLPEPFASYPFDAPAVKAAYLSHCRRAIAHYQPDYLAIALEANLLALHDIGAWPALASLLRDTYTGLKADHPDLPIFVTVTAVDLLEGWTSADHASQLAVLAEILTFSDYLALSFYPFMSAHLTNPVPDGAFDDLAALAQGKPLVIAETGYPAQTTALPSYGLTFEGTPSKQDQWITRVLAEAEARQMPFVVNFVARDYDALWVAAGSDEALAIWRDTGLVDEDGTERPALDTWRIWLAVSRQ